jgi:hypothetical protein
VPTPSGKQGVRNTQAQNGDVQPVEPEPDETLVTVHVERPMAGKMPNTVGMVEGFDAPSGVYEI